MLHLRRGTVLYSGRAASCTLGLENGSTGAVATDPAESVVAELVVATPLDELTGGVESLGVAPDLESPRRCARHALTSARRTAHAIRGPNLPYGCFTGSAWCPRRLVCLALANGVAVAPLATSLHRNAVYSVFLTRLEHRTDSVPFCSCVLARPPENHPCLTPPPPPGCAAKPLRHASSRNTFAPRTFAGSSSHRAGCG